MEVGDAGVHQIVFPDAECVLHMLRINNVNKVFHQSSHVYLFFHHLQEGVEVTDNHFLVGMAVTHEVREK